MALSLPRREHVCVRVHGWTENTQSRAGGARPSAAPLALPLSDICPPLPCGDMVHDMLSQLRKARRRRQRWWKGRGRRFFHKGRREIFLKHKYLVLPLLLSQPYFNCRKRPQKHYFLRQNSAIYKNGSKALAARTLCFMAFMAIILKNISPSFWHNLNPIWLWKATGPISHQSWNMRAPIQHYYGSKSKPPSNSSPPVGNGRQNSQDMAVLCI